MANPSLKGDITFLNGIDTTLYSVGLKADNTLEMVKKDHAFSIFFAG